MDDKALIQGILRRDPTAGSQLYRRYLNPLYNFIYHRSGSDHQDAEDLCQITFMEAWRHIKSFDLDKDFWPWLCGIAKRRINRHFRKKKMIPSEVKLEKKISKAPTPSEQAMGKETRLAINLAFSTLSPRHQFFLKQRLIHKKSSKEIGKAQNLSPEAVDSVLQRARAAFKKLLEKDHA